MEQIEKIFKNVKSINHSANSSQGKNILRIKDKYFSIKSIYKIIEHINWIIEKRLTNLKLKILLKQPMKIFSSTY